MEIILTVLLIVGVACWSAHKDKAEKERKFLKTCDELDRIVKSADKRKQEFKNQSLGKD